MGWYNKNFTRFAQIPQEESIDLPIKEDESYSVPIGDDDFVLDLLKERAHNKENKTGAGSFEFLKENPRFRAYNSNSGLSSAYIDKGGEVHVIDSHHHDEVAQSVISKMLDAKGLPVTKHTMRAMTSHLMPLLSGAIRVQFYHSGVGGSIDMANPPSVEQIRSLKDHYDQTTKQIFVVEIYYKKKPIATIQSYEDLLAFLLNYKGEKKEDTPQQELIREFLTRQDADESWYGKERVAGTKRKRIIFAEDSGC